MTDTTHSPTPPKGPGPLAKREARLAWGLLFPTLAIVSLVVLLPLLAIFWISVKPVELSDLRPPTVVMNEGWRGRDMSEGAELGIDYRLRLSSADATMTGVGFSDVIPEGLIVGAVPAPCTLDGRNLDCDWGDVEGRFRERVTIPAVIGPAFAANPVDNEDSPAVLRGEGDFILTNFDFTLENFTKVFSARDFGSVLFATAFYTIVGTIGALGVGLMAALLLNQSFRGQGLLRGLYLFPYVAPVIAVAFTWVTLFNPFSGSVNALLLQMGVTDAPINFFGDRPLALIMVTVFEIWRYFPLSFLFILARMQSIDTDMYEAADMDGASPFQKFRYLSLPMLLGILSVLFLLRFIWTFNKFDDIFLLTGGNAGTRTLTVNVYEQAFAISNIGAGAAVAVVVFGTLLVFAALFFRFISQEEGL
ncbi:carbohydrate ABC transporter permease [Jannaschia sp. M317]|uniref:carbohydrate ABC transporter permease n=1 Tax=Jannaschia sp. M317 TaxID=2867011 RepID=UPI0021A6F6C8|nr:sugar ABC transporter permease [Jannaschia sp. M317]UWQ17490.1 sugar ABC transporter permease [Jannaschia sp. M317]